MRKKFGMSHLCISVSLSSLQNVSLSKTVSLIHTFCNDLWVFKGRNQNPLPNDPSSFYCWRRIMANNQTLGSSVNLCLWVLVLSFSLCPFLCSSSYDDDPSSYNSFIISSFDYSKSKLDPFEWRYIRVDLPDWFSSMSLKIESDVDIDDKRARKLPKSKLPIICFREGSPPLPDASNNSINNLVLGPLTNGSNWGVQDLQNVEQCHLLQKHITLNLTNNQISPGIWYFGIYNGIGPLRTQSKMITRGSSYTFSASVTVEGCETSTMWGPYCNQTVDSLSCAQSNVYNLSDAIHNQTIKNVITCRNSYDNACHRSKERKVYFMDILGIAEQLMITAADFRFNGTSSTNNTGTFSGNLMCYARHGAMPSSTLHDYSSHISKTPLVILSPKIGRWYFAILPINPTAVRKMMQDNKTNIDFCYSLDGQIQECPLGKAGPNCTWKIYTLQTILRKNPSVPFESYYLPVSEGISPFSANFLLEPLLSNSSVGDKFTWTYFILDIPFGAAGGNIHIQLTSDAKIDYEIYSRFGGLPSLETWDYYYANGTSSSNHSMFFQVYDSSDVGVSFSILYAREGTWTFGLRHRVLNGSHPKQQTSMSISIERCPKRCSGHGECRSFVDLGGLALYSYCACDRTHGGFDCSIEIVSHRGHVLQSIALIASNAAAILPAFWALRHKAFAEWVLFTSSGISSGLYHACDVGTWCVLNFHVLQFMDFWLSFMAVVSTFVYLSTIDDVSKRPIHTIVSILTALMAITGPTRPINIILVIAIGAVVLLIGWLLEYSSTIRSLSCSTWVCLNILERWESVKVWFYSFIRTLRDRFRWGFVITGAIALSMAGVSWKLETSETYWIWHSFWHVTIYTSSFFFLCSKVNKDNQETSVAVYELTRQDSFPRTTV